MKGRTVALIIILVVLADQALKFYIKLHYRVGDYNYVLGQWSQLYFIENEGMAYGWKFGGDFGKIILTLFRLVAVGFGVWYLRSIVEKKDHPGFIICASLIFAGAFGNLIDSMFYGLIFDESTQFHIATLFPKEGGYATFLHGKVVDMLYFPIIQNASFPNWVPFVGDDKSFIFFRPIFNLADASISIGVITILIFQRKFFRHYHEEETMADANGNPQ